MEKQGHALGWGLRALLGAGILYFALNGKWEMVGILLMSLGASGIAYYVCKHFLGNTGQWMDALFSLLLVFNNLLGLGFDFYHTIPGWDITTHYTTSVFLAVSALVLMQKAYPQLLKEAPPLLIVVGMILFSLGLGAVWELGEFSSDFLRGTDFQGGLTNTMQDFLVDMIAGLVVSIAWIKRPK
ncbi:MAG: hypothetical protein V1776_01885 [Candidatus Diapherotrites archaeon]